MRLPLSSLLLVASLGCDATYVDLRPSGGEGAAASLPPAPPLADTDVVLARGTFEGRAGHAGSGEVALVAHEDGSRSLRFAEDFVSSGVPGPVLYLSERPVFGAGDAALEDLEVGPLTSKAGAQSYRLPDDVPRYMWVWIWCRPFGVEVARAMIKEVVR